MFHGSAGEFIIYAGVSFLEHFSFLLTVKILLPVDAEVAGIALHYVRHSVLHDSQADNITFAFGQGVFHSPVCAVAHVKSHKHSRVVELSGGETEVGGLHRLRQRQLEVEAVAVAFENDNFLFSFLSLVRRIFGVIFLQFSAGYRT